LNDDIATLLKRAGELIHNFETEIQNDKLIRCCLILVFITPLIVVILWLYGVRD
jgi:hypothetical protein